MQVMIKAGIKDNVIDTVLVGDSKLSYNVINQSRVRESKLGKRKNHWHAISDS